jgi:superfamily II DNA/RNA helicase
VIANAIAYEGIDLQTRTCAIHHLDLPWEPATLQQRNGRGVRQGNTLSAIEIYYYFSRRSQDGLRFNLIQGKRGWMTQLLKSQDRDTNNPGAQMDMGPEEILLLISRNPEKTRGPTRGGARPAGGRGEEEDRQRGEQAAARHQRALPGAERTADPPRPPACAARPRSG